MAFLRKNFAFGTLAADINDVVTQLTMTAGHSLPTAAGTFRLTIWDNALFPDPADAVVANDLEIVTAAYSGTPNVYNITRAQESTAAVAHSANDKVAMHYTAGMSEDDLTDAVITHEVTFTHASIALNTTHRGLVAGNPHNVTVGDIGASPTSHRHDTHTLEHDGVNSNGGAFAFNTTGDVAFNQRVIAPNLTLTGFSGILKASTGVVAGSADHGDLNDMPSSSNTNHDLRYPTRAEWLQNGFPNRTDSSISFNDGTRRFTINPSGGSFDYFIAGVKYTVSSSDVENVNYVYLGDTPAEGTWHIYYDGSTLTATVSPNQAAVRDIYENKAVVAIVFWDADNNKGQLFEDRHGMSMSPFTHILFHDTVGTRFDSGLALNSITADENGSADSHAQFGVDAGQIFDEDIEHTLNAIGSTTGLQIWYRDTGGAGWTFTTNAGFSMIKTGVGGEDRLAYDNSGTLTEVTNGDFVLCHIFATSMAHLNPVVAIGQAEYATKKSAQQGALTEIINILSIGNIAPELKPIATVIFQTKDTYSNSIKARIVSTDEGDDYVDFRTDVLTPAFSSAQSHGNLAGLGNDDHTQYLLADGTRALAGAWDMDNQNLTNVNIDSGVISGITDLAIGDGGTGQSTAQAAIDALTAVAGGGNEEVLTKDTGSGNAIWKESVGGAGAFVDLSDTPVSIDSGDIGKHVIVGDGLTLEFMDKGFVDRGNLAANDFDEGDLITDNTWRDLNLSGILPAGTKSVYLRVLILDDAAGSYLFFKNKDYADDVNSVGMYTPAANIGVINTYQITVDSNREIQYLGANLTFTTINIAVVGWWF